VNVFFKAGKTDFMSHFENRQHVHASKNEKVKVYLRIKPTKEAAQMLPPPQNQTFQVQNTRTLVLITNVRESLTLYYFHRARLLTLVNTIPTHALAIKTLIIILKNTKPYICFGQLTGHHQGQLAFHSIITFNRLNIRCVGVIYTTLKQ
jgi:hypothetical protein